MPPDPLAREVPVSVDDALTALGDSDTLALLGVTSDDLKHARTDHPLFESLSSTHALLGALRDEGMLGIFLLLPFENQASFVRWIATIEEADVRRDLTDTLIAALQESPLGASSAHGS